MRTKSLAVAALFMALVMVTTAFVKIPLPLTGYIHLGDTFIFLACFFLKNRMRSPRLQWAARWPTSSPFPYTRPPR